MTPDEVLTLRNNIRKILEDNGTKIIRVNETDRVGDEYIFGYGLNNTDDNIVNSDAIDEIKKLGYYVNWDICCDLEPGSDPMWTLYIFVCYPDD